MYLQPRADNAAYGGLGPMMLGISWAECLLAIILVGLRGYGASLRAGRLRWDFVWVATGTLLGLITQILFSFACLNGLGRHMKDLSFPQLFATLKYTWTGLMVGLAGTTIAKLGIIALLLQVATPQQRKRKIFLWGVGVSISVIGVAQMVITLTQCEPFDRLWYRAKPGHCDRSPFAAKFGYFQGATAAGADVILALYPVTIVWNMQASVRTKVGFCVLMASGVIAAAAAVVRTYYVKRLENPTDFTWEFVPFLSWAATELYVVIIIACIPPLRPLFKRWFGKARSTFAESYGMHTGSGNNRDVALHSAATSSRSRKQFSAHVMTNPEEGGSQENILHHGLKDHADTIVISKGYTIEVDRR